MKSPFKLFSLNAREADQKGNYANPELGRYKATTFDHEALSGIKNSKIAYNKKPEPSKSVNSIGLGGKKHEGFGLKDRYTDTLPETPNVNTNLTKGGFGRFTDKDSKAIVPNLVDGKNSSIATEGGKKVLRLPTYREAYDKDIQGVRTTKGYKDFDDYESDMLKIQPGDTRDLEREAARSALNKKGSPVKHNDQQEVSGQQKLGDIMKQPGGIIANAAKFMRSRKADRSAVGSIAGAQPQSSATSRAGSMFAGKSMAEIKAMGQEPTGSISGGAGLFGAAAQAARAAAASQELLPPPNQVAESGSYAGTGDRILEMDSNPVANQSIGRDTDITSQLFGSGQRASMLAMNGTPLHDKGHADDYEGHTHRKKGKSYKEGEYIDESDFESLNTKLNAYDREEIKKDRKSQFIVTKNTDFNPVKIDTIRPSKGKTFKMTWGDAERNISTNPNYKNLNK